MNVLAKIIIIITLLSIGPIVWAQNGKFAGMGNASVMLPDFWGITNNQAGLARLEKSAVGIDYENKFMLKETSRQTAGFMLATKTGNFALSWSRFGYSLYSENDVGLAYARDIGKYVSAGVQFDYAYFSQPEGYQNKGAPLLQAGIIVRPLPNLFIGTHVYNLTRTSIDGINQEQLPSNFRMGVGYNFPGRVMLTCEAEKLSYRQLNIKAGIQYQPVEQLFIRTGLNTHPNQFSMGMGYEFNKLCVDISATSHEVLPLSSQISLTYNFQK